MEYENAAAIELDTTTWEAMVEKAALPVVIMFYSPICPHCRTIRPYFEEYAQEFKGRMIFALLNVTVHPWIGEKYGIRGTPTFKFFCNGEPVQELVGVVYPTILKKIAGDVLSYGPECAEKSTKIYYGITGYG